MSRTLIHKCDLSLAKDNIGYMIAILATHSRLSLFGCWTMDLESWIQKVTLRLKQKNPKYWPNLSTAKKTSVTSSLPIGSKNTFSIGQHGE